MNRQIVSKDRSKTIYFDKPSTNNPVLANRQTPSSNKILAFSHIPKTAGTSFNHLLRRHFGSSLMAARPRKGASALYRCSDFLKDNLHKYSPVIKQCNELDQQLYEYALQRFSSQVTSFEMGHPPRASSEKIRLIQRVNHYINLTALKLKID